jgi:predicted DCC family thiol-disulfide oxidoreductase YuxK
MTATAGAQTKPILLYNGECAVCRSIGRWVEKSARGASGESSIIERPIGDDPTALRLLNPRLDIWDAYETIHMLMPDGSMKLGGEAVAEVLRDLPNTKWFAWSFGVSVFGFRPFQRVLDLGYLMLAGVRPLLGCESCGMPNVWAKSLAWIVRRAKPAFGRTRQAMPHFTSTTGAGTTTGSAEPQTP